MNANKVSPEKLRKVQELVNNLLARADHPTTPAPEAKVSRERAERLMAQYRIDEANLDAVEKARMGIKPTHRVVRVYPLGSEFSMQYRTMLAYIVNHVEATAVSILPEDGWVVWDVFGFESDLAYAEMLWASVRIAFQQRLEPEHDGSLSDEENVFRMRNAGMERGRIGEVMGWGGEGTQGPNKVTRVFKRACAERGVDAKAVTGKGNNMKTFRHSYAEAFASEIWNRLWELRTARGQMSGAVVLANRADEVKEFMYTVYPQMRPRPVDPNAPVAKQRPMRFRKAKERPVNWNAARLGQQAARTVDIGGVGGRRLED